MQHYDIIFGISTYRSNDLINRFLASTHNLLGKNLFVVISPIEQDMLNAFYDNPSNDVVFMTSKINNHVLGRSWPFVWAVNNGISAKYYCECDDDLEWTKESGKIFGKLEKGWKELPYAMFGFDSTHPYGYKDFERMQGKLKVGVPWLDGNCIFTRWQDNLECGVMDSLPTAPLAFFVETEYAHRLRYLTNRPIVMDTETTYYIHHFRDNPNLFTQRKKTFTKAVEDGRRFWKEKFGLDVEFKGDVHKTLYQKETAPECKDGFRKHLLFDGLFTDWKAIYTKFAPNFTVLESL